MVDTGKIANDPVKAGYTFAGWATTSDGEVKYSMADIKDVPEGTVLYAKWTLTQKA